MKKKIAIISFVILLASLFILTQSGVRILNFNEKPLANNLNYDDSIILKNEGSVSRDKPVQVIAPMIISEIRDGYNIDINTNVILKLDDNYTYVSSSGNISYIEAEEFESYKTYPSLRFTSVGEGFVVFQDKAGIEVVLKINITSKFNVRDDAILGESTKIISGLEEINKSLIGMNIEKAKIYLDENKITYRIVKIDEESLAVTEDYSDSRINLEIKDNVITNSYRG